ncbi:unnamed protein product, partial [Meganyctiphanes norvegica]
MKTSLPKPRTVRNWSGITFSLIRYYLIHENMIYKIKLLSDLRTCSSRFAVLAARSSSNIVTSKLASEDAPELGMRPSFLSTFGMATDQASKLGMGKNTKIVCVYGTYQIIHFNCAPLVITAIGLSGANTGQIMQLDTELQPLVQHLTPVVDIQE